MKAKQVDHALCQKFAVEGERLVFWHDPNGEFADYVRSGFGGDIADVRVLNVDEVGGLSAKLRLERKDTAGRYLVYSQGEFPAAEEDWLLDIRLYSAEFHADVASVWRQELGLRDLSLRDYLRDRTVFLGSQDRRKRLKRFVNADDGPVSLDLKMMAVLTGSPVASAFDVLRAICHDHVRGEGEKRSFDLIQPPEIMATFEKMGLGDRFWELMRNEFAYSAESPSLAGLLRRLFVSELFHQMDDVRMDSLSHHKLPGPGQRNAVVFLTQWRDSSQKARSYAAAAAAVADEQRVREPLAHYGVEIIKDVYTFWEAEKFVVHGLKEKLLRDLPAVDVEEISAIATERKAGHWLSGPGSNRPDRLAMTGAYDAIIAAAEFFALHAERRWALTFETPGALLTAYQTGLYRFDQLYRRFWSRSRSALGQGWDLLKTLADEVERVYDQGFLQPLGVEWSRLLDDGFLSRWALEGLPAQRNFYAQNIRDHLAESERRRAFVIISDALRYEAAHELVETLNGVYRIDARLSAMLGVLPSFTALGMASLLPHERLSFSDKGDVLVDGKPSTGTEVRNKKLACVQGMACLAGELLAMKQDEAREFTEGRRVVYVYHNAIDATGDSASTEGQTFDAVSACISELVELVQFCVNRLNAGKVWVTADHGFLFQQEAPGVTDKSMLSHKPKQAVKMKKRYVIGPALGTTPEAHHGSIEVTAGAGGGMEFWVPRSVNRFHFAGGARFVHGGAMPQEIMVPLVTITHLRGKKKEASRSEKVSVQVLGTSHKITTPTHRFEFIQTEAVNERRKPVTLRVAVYEGTHAVTSVESITFDSTSDSIEQRKKSIKLELRTGTYDKTTPYRLVLRDVESDAEVFSMPVVIDRSFDDDF